MIVRGAVIIPSRLNANARLLVAHESGGSSTGRDQAAHVLPELESYSSLFVLDDADLGRPKHAAVELEALLLDIEDGVILLSLLRAHEGGLVLVRVELLAGGVETLQAVLLEGVHEDVLGHLEALVQLNDVLELIVLLGRLKPLLGDHGESAVEVVDALDQVLGEALDGELAGVLDLALGPVLEVAEVCDGAQAFVLDEM